MPLNPRRGDMYEWVTHTHTHLGGECPHRCRYCYVKAFGAPSVKARYIGPVRLIEKELAVNYGSGRTIFVEHLNDVCGRGVSDEWIALIMGHCRDWPHNRYVLQSKNPKRLKQFEPLFPKSVIVGTTIETNRHDGKLSQAPSPAERAEAMQWFDRRTFVTIEPIMDFDLEEFVGMLKLANPSFVNIGADSCGHGLPEPSPEKVLALVARLREMGLDVREKANLRRLMNPSLVSAQLPSVPSTEP